MPNPLWQPSPEYVRTTNMTAFMEAVNAEWGLSIGDTTALHAFSVTEMGKFWDGVRTFSDVRGSGWDGPVLVDGDKLPGAKWYPQARLNFAENLLRRRDDADAIVFWGEDKVRRRMSYAELYDRVSELSQALRAGGLGPGDRVAGYLPNMPEAVIAMLATASIGAVWSSCSPDFGVQGVLDRFGQTEPRILFAADGYHYNGKTHDGLAKLKDVIDGLAGLEQVVVVPYVSEDPDLSGLDGAVLLGEFTAPFAAADIDFEQLPFDHPLYIMFSSGTTGAPKCIIHGAGGTLFKHASEHRLHCDIRAGDRVFFFTTCGWMMWNWLVSVLASEATLVLYDGSPFYPTFAVLFDFADTEAMTLFGTSAKFIDALAKSGTRPIDTHKLTTVRQLCSTGSPLAPEGFDFVYEAIKSDVHLASITGGTDIMGVFAGGDPTLAVWRGEIQCRFLGMAVDVVDADGRPLRQEKGELVCTKPFPSVPLGFLNDPDGRRFHEAYFDVYPNVWCHGDYVEITENDGLVVYGRSDATLNPGGVRIGTAEIYRQVEKLDEVMEGIVIGQEWDNDVRIVLFVVLKEGIGLDDSLADRIKA